MRQPDLRPHSGVLSAYKPDTFAIFAQITSYHPLATLKPEPKP